MSLDMQNFDLFAKKKPAPLKPMAPIVSAPVIEEQIIEAVPAKVETPVIMLEEPVIKVETQTEEIKTPKYETFLPITTRISEDDFQALKKIENTIMRNRKKGGPKDRERITANSILRCVVSNFLERANDLDLTNIDNEIELQERLEKAFKQKYTKRSLDN